MLYSNSLDSIRSLGTSIRHVQLLSAFKSHSHCDEPQRNYQITLILFMFKYSGNGFTLYNGSVLMKIYVPFQQATSFGAGGKVDQA